jgi:hypothetical protein
MAWLEESDETRIRDTWTMDMWPGRVAVCSARGRAPKHVNCVLKDADSIAAYLIASAEAGAFLVAVYVNPDAGGKRREHYEFIVDPSTEVMINAAVPSPKLAALGYRLYGFLGCLDY